MNQIKLLIYICLLPMLINYSISFAYQSPDWIPFPADKQRPIDHVLLNDKSDMLVIMGTSHFTLGYKQSKAPSPLTTFDFFNDKVTSLVKCSLNGNIIIECKSNYLLMITENGTKVGA